MLNYQTELFSASILLLIALIISCILILLAYLFSTQAPSQEKLSAYECGFKKFMSVTALPFDIHFYKVGILFLIFYVEITFLFPWAVSFNKISLIGHLFIFFFLGILLIGFIFEWKMKALTWSPRKY